MGTRRQWSFAVPGSLALQAGPTASHGKCLPLSQTIGWQSPLRTGRGGSVWGELW